MAVIALERVRKAYPGDQVAVRDASLEIADGELVVLVGPSGSGKSTLLRLIAGLDAPTAGRILIDGRDVTGVPPQRRNLAMVFQSYALYPHLTVRENLSFGLRMHRRPAREIAERVARVAATLDIEPLLGRKPSQLSGGQRQRVALGRAIVREPRAFLFDEPLSNLDPALRSDVRAELALLHWRLRATMIYVTHDQEEAMTLGTRIAVMRGGAIEQVGAPLEVYRTPVNAFVAGFVGSPPMNLMRGSWIEGRRIELGTRGPVLELEPRGSEAGGDVLVGIRPHDVEIAAPPEADAGGRVQVVEPLGSSVVLHLAVEAVPDRLLRMVVPPETRAATDQVVPIRFRRDRLHFFDPRTGRRLPID
jgi:multiple sugar transport system ATP-binding protein